MKQIKYPKLYIGAMSKNIVDSVIEYSEDNNVILGLVASENQINNKKGYCNNWNTLEFCKYIKDRTDKIIIERDHAIIKNNDFDVSKNDNCMDIIHLDPWKLEKDLNKSIDIIINFLQYCKKLNINLKIEIGTEESVRPFNVEELDFLVNSISDITKDIIYVVIQSGTKLLGNNNIGLYNETKLNDMIQLIKKYGLLSKEHNGDYLDVNVIKRKFEIGLDAINIAPEFGMIETESYLNKIINNKDLFEYYFKICYESNTWNKWVDKNFNPYDNMIDIIKICGHYLLADEKFQIIKKFVGNIDEEIKLQIKKKIYTILN